MAQKAWSLYPATPIPLLSWTTQAAIPAPITRARVTTVTHHRRLGLPNGRSDAARASVVRVSVVMTSVVRASVLMMSVLMPHLRGSGRGRGCSRRAGWSRALPCTEPVSYTHLRAHETDSYLVCRLLLEKKKR